MTSEAATGLPTTKDVAETLCFLAGHGPVHPERPFCPKNWLEADRIVRALAARYAFRAAHAAQPTTEDPTE